MIFFTSDQHFNHEAIIEMTGRPYGSLRYMERDYISKYNSVVSYGDTVYFLGDFFMGTNLERHKMEKILSQMKGDKILILGNHDTMNPFIYIESGFMSAHTSLYLLPQELFLVHDPCVACVVRDTTVLAGHVHTLFKHVGNVINVGVDMHGGFPVALPKIEEIINIYGNRKVDRNNG